MMELRSKRKMTWNAFGEVMDAFLQEYYGNYCWKMR